LSVRPQKNVNVQILRAVAAALVVLDHVILSLHEPELTQFAYQAGNIGVWIFFVISGFVMHHSERSHFGAATNAAAFAWKRFSRIAPMYWIITLVVIAQVAASTAAGHEIPAHAVLTFSHILKSLLFIPYVDAVAPPHPILAPGWTLEYEMIFYFVFGLSMILPIRRGLLFVLVVISTLFLIGTFLNPLWVAADHKSISSFMTDCVVLLFIASIGLSAIWHATEAALPSWFLCVAAAIVSAVIAAFYVLKLQYPITPLCQMLFFIPCIAVVAICAYARPLSGPIAQIAIFLGDASYATYLSNVLVIAGVVKYLPRLVQELSLPASLFLVVVAALAAGAITHVLIERPLLRKMRQLGQVRRNHGSMQKSARA